MSIRVFERLLRHNGLRSWTGLGLAVQAYQKRALPCWNTSINSPLSGTA